MNQTRPFYLLFSVLFSLSFRGAWAPDRAEAQAFEPKPGQEPEAAHAGGKPELTRQQIQEALRAYASEPSVQEVVKAALEEATADPEKARAMASRARLAGWVPTAKVAIRRGLARDLSESQTLETDRTALSANDDMVIEASLTFELQRLVFDHDEVALAREEREIVQAREELARAVIQLYFERRRLQLERDLLRSAGIERELRIAELEALLDAFTGGRFRRMIMLSKRAASKREAASRP